MGGDADVVVIGASLAGLFAAAACAGQGREVAVLERDELPDEPVPRSGVPQGSHQHVLLHRGLLCAEQLLPGLRDDLLAAGGESIDTADLLWLTRSGWLVTGRPEFEIVSLTRPLLEQVVRARVAALPGVTIAGRREVRGAIGSRGQVTGVATGPTARLVVDASGRASRLPEWLRELGVAAPPAEVVDARIGYSSRLFLGDRHEFGGAGLFVLATPEIPTGASALPVEGGRWLLTAVGVGDQRPPRDEVGFARFLRELRDPALAEFVDRATPVSPVTVHRQTGNQRRRYERVAHWPRGLLVVGDAMTAFNPVYGHGITVAVQQALALRDAVPRVLTQPAEQALLRRLARIAALPWGIATSEDLRYPTSKGRQTLAQRTLSAYAGALGDLATHGDVASRYAVSEVYHLMAPPTRLLAPPLLAALLRSVLRGLGDPVPRPAALAPSRAARI